MNRSKSANTSKHILNSASQKIEMSQIYRPNIKQYNRFVPFHIERDKLGRLLKQEYNNKQIQIETKYDHKSVKKVYPSNIQTNILKYFKNCEPVQQKKGKKSKLKLLKIIEETNKNNKVDLQIFNKKAQDQSIFRLVKFPSTYTEAPQVTRQSSPNKTISNWKRSPQKRIQSSNNNKILKRKISLPQKKVNYEDIKTESSSPNKNLVLSYPELDRYNKMMELGMQTCNTFEQGHLKFLHKMNFSKQLVFEVKMGLDAIDGYI